MQHKQLNSLTWPALIHGFVGKGFGLEDITALVNERRFPSYSKSLPLSDIDVSNSKDFFKILINHIIEADVQQCLGYSRLSFLVCGVVRGNLALFEEETYKRLLDLFLSIDTLPPNSEHGDAVAAALSSLLFLHSMDVKSGHSSADGDSVNTNPDMLDRHRGEMCLVKLASILECSRCEIKTEISCLHAVIQLLVHRTFLQCNSSRTETLRCIARVVKALWPIALIPKRQATDCASGSNSSYGPSSASELSDGWCGDFMDSGRPSAVNKKKARQLATYCLRSLLMSKQVCREVWSMNFDDRQFLQSSLLSAISHEQDPSLREKFIYILLTVLNNLETSFTVAEELPNRDSASYIPYSVRLANELREIHQGLYGALINEKLGLLKAIGTLVAVTPYHRLQPGLLTTLINKTSAFLKNNQNDPVKFANLQASILAVWDSVLAKTNLTPELLSLIASKLDPVVFSGYQMPPQSSCWLIDLCLQILSETKFPSLRNQAASLLRAFISLHFSLFQPFMGAVKAMIRQNLPPKMEDPVSCTLNILILCDIILTRQFDCLEKGRFSNLSIDCEWWYDLVGTLLDSASKSPNTQECWWICQVTGMFFDLLAVLASPEPSFPQISLNIPLVTSLCSRSIDLYVKICNGSCDLIKPKALRRLCRLAILDASFIPSNLLCQALNIVLQSIVSSTGKIAGFVSEMAYCLELCTLKAVKSFPNFVIPDKLFTETLKFASLENQDISSWTQLDCRRSEHVIHSLANIINLGKITDERVSNFINVFGEYLKISVHSGAAKIRWNAMLSTAQLINLPQRYSILTILCEKFSSDPYFKVRVHAGMTILLLFNDHYPQPNSQEISLILSTALKFLSSDDQQGSGSGNFYSATHHVQFCHHIAIKLLLKCAVRALQNNSQSDLESISTALNEENQTLNKNLGSSLYFAKEAKITAFAVMKATRRGLKGGGLARVPDQPTLISFAERYDPLKCLNFDDSLSEFLDNLETLQLELRRNKEAKELIRLFYVLTNGSTVEELRENLLKPFRSL